MSTETESNEMPLMLELFSTAQKHGATKIVYQTKKPSGHFIHLELELGKPPPVYELGVPALKKIQVPGKDGLTLTEQEELYGKAYDAKEEE